MPQKPTKQGVHLWKVCQIYPKIWTDLPSKSIFLLQFYAKFKSMFTPKGMFEFATIFLTWFGPPPGPPSPFVKNCYIGVGWLPSFTALKIAGRARD